jgi:hypothetical protein
MATAEKATPAKTVKKKNLLQAPKKKPVRVRRAHLHDEKYTGSEPQWDTDRAAAMSDEEFDHYLAKSLYYYNYHYTVKDLKPDLVKWLQEQTYFKISKDDLSKIIKSRWVSPTACKLVAAHRVGMPWRERSIKFVEAGMREVVDKFDSYNEEDLEANTVTPKETTTATPYKPTIQDRLNEKFGEIVGEMDGWYDEVIEGAELKPKTYEHLTAMITPQAMVGKIRNHFERYKTELEEAQAGTDEQLTEAYAKYKARDYKRHYTFLNAVLEDCDRYAQTKKTTRKARVKKSPSKEKLVSKLKYCKEAPALKLVSINPVDILSATELWVYNTKTRKLGKYVTDQYSGALNVKGASIVGFDEKKSVSKTLRKPEQQLAEFMKSGKIQLRKYLDNIKATETLLNGRINADVLLLRAIS